MEKINLNIGYVKLFSSTQLYSTFAYTLRRLTNILILIFFFYDTL